MKYMFVAVAPDESAKDRHGCAAVGVGEQDQHRGVVRWGDVDERRSSSRQSPTGA